MKPVLNLVVPGRERVERLGIAVDRGDAMARGQERFRHRKTDAARRSGEKNGAAVRRCHDCLRLNLGREAYWPNTPIVEYGGWG